MAGQGNLKKCTALGVIRSKLLLVIKPLHNMVPASGAQQRAQPGCALGWVCHGEVRVGRGLSVWTLLSCDQTKTTFLPVSLIS